MRRRTGLFFPVLLAAILLALPSSTPAATNETDKERRDTYRELELFANVLTLVQQHYVDPVEMRGLMNGAVGGMLDSLDPHSGYLSPEDYQELEEETSGSFTGIGIEITVRDGALTVVAPIDDSPAERAGILPGDRIDRIDGASAKNMSLTEAMKKMRGPKGKAITLSIRRAQWRGAKDFKLVREDISLHSVKSALLEPGYGYVRISSFQDATTEDLLAALDKLREKEPLKGLALDLRNNPGGLLDQAIRVADVFLEHGVIVSTKGRADQEQVLYEAHPDTQVEDYPIVVLINGGSASGSEIVAGALRDHKRARTLGTTSFGKGSVQTVIPLPDGAGIRLTTAKYYTPSGDSIQATGIKPDIPLPLNVPPAPDDGSDHKTLREKDLPGHLDNDTLRRTKKARESAKGDEEADNADQEEGFQRVNSIADMAKRLEEDNQLRRALEVLKGE